jgi:hypothetical protein
MSRFSRVLVLVVGLMTVFAAMAGAASATTWTNSGDTAFTATSGPGTLTAGGPSAFACTGGTATGVAPSTELGPTYLVTGDITFSPCRVLLSNVVITCSYTLTGLPPVTGGVTTANLTVNCTDSLLLCRITGSIPGKYTNATTTASGFLTVNGSTGLNISACFTNGAAVLSPNPYKFTVSSGVGGTHPANRFGPILGQP